MTNYWYLDYSEPTPIFKKTQDPNIAKVYQCIQEILLWRGENLFDVNLGIDYNSIFGGSVFLTAQLEEIVDKYRLYFDSILMELTQEKQVVYINLQFVFFSQVDLENQNAGAMFVKIAPTPKQGEPINVEVR